MLVGAADVIPTTKDAPLLASVLTLFPVTVEDVPDEPIVMPEIAPALVIFETVLLLTRLPLPPLPPPNEELIPIIALVPPVILLNVLPEML